MDAAVYGTIKLVDKLLTKVHPVLAMEARFRSRTSSRWDRSSLCLHFTYVTGLLVPITYLVSWLQRG